MNDVRTTILVLTAVVGGAMDDAINTSEDPVWHPTEATDSDPLIAADGSVICLETLDEWCEFLDHDRWPTGWENRSDIVHGKPPSH